jgi:hypothetical protein
MENQDRLAEATQTVNGKIGFYIHLLVFVLVNAGLAAINYGTSREHLWFVWPLLGWGIGVFGHALIVFFGPSVRGIRDRMIAREMEKLAGQQRMAPSATTSAPAEASTK